MQARAENQWLPDVATTWQTRSMTWRAGTETASGPVQL